MAVTDNSWGNTLRQNVAKDIAAMAAGYNRALDADVLVLWAESHDTFATDDANQSSLNVSGADIIKTWALVAARADAMGLYLARPESMDQAIGVASVTGWADPTVREINLFHNAFIGKSEHVANENGVSYVERGDSGVILVQVAPNTARASSISVTAHALADGTYTDQITGNVFTVENGIISGQIGDTGIAVVYNVPTYDVTVETAQGGKVTASADEAREGDTVTLTVTADEGKQLDTLTAVDADGKAVTLARKGNVYTFTMPASNVTVTPVFKAEEPIPAPAYTVTVKDAEGGKIKADMDKAEEGETVTLTVEADAEYTLDKLTVVDAAGKAVTVTGKDGAYTFVMPASDVTVTPILRAVTYSVKVSKAEGV